MISIRRLQKLAGIRLDESVAYTFQGPLPRRKFEQILTMATRGSQEEGHTSFWDGMSWVQANYPGVKDSDFEQAILQAALEGEWDFDSDDQYAKDLSEKNPKLWLETILHIPNIERASKGDIVQHLQVNKKNEHFQKMMTVLKMIYPMHFAWFEREVAG